MKPRSQKSRKLPNLKPSRPDPAAAKRVKGGALEAYPTTSGAKQGPIKK